jgi:hypothetical protein
MKLHYYPETDSLYIELKSAPGMRLERSSQVSWSTSMPTVKLWDSTSTMPPASSTCPKSRRSPFRRPARRSDTSGRYPQPVIAGLDPAIHPLQMKCFFDGCPGHKRVYARLPTRYARA